MGGIRSRHRVRAYGWLEISLSLKLNARCDDLKGMMGSHVDFTYHKHHNSARLEVSASSLFILIEVMMTRDESNAQKASSKGWKDILQRNPLFAFCHKENKAFSFY